ncbi:helix-turn-helix domain-containing protein [Kribbella sp. HUAS MG21]|uniref:Helix-turn-helix domain-containing protein n=1 Tax=Kribbella sp. HUAS MG21 TaxID=3160966 RepID=A0AAU7T7X8_9ACTN
MANGPEQLQELIDTLALATGSPVTLEDRELNLVVSSGHEDVIDEVRRASILRRRSTADVQGLFAAFGIARATEPLRIPGDPGAGRLSRWCVPVRWRQVTYGYLWLLDPDETVPGDLLGELHEVFGQIAAAMALRSRAAERTTWAVGELLSADAGARVRATEELRSHGALPPTGTVVVVALAPQGGGPLGPVNSWLLPGTVLAAPMGQRAALIVPNTDRHTPAAVGTRVARSLVSQHPAGVAVGISGPVDPTTGDLGWRQADAALRVALTHQPPTTPAPADSAVVVREWGGLGVRRLLALAGPGVITATLVDERIRRLYGVDADLLVTVRTYLDQAGSAQRTAAVLTIHRQTLYQRLRRIEELTGLDLSDGSDRLLTHLALTLDPP